MDRNVTRLCFGLLLLLLGAIGYWMLFSNLAVYDDEGYVLLSAREYFARGGLYESVYTQYGPAFYALTDAFQRLLGGPVDHASARWLTLGLWLAGAAGCGALVHQQTRSAVLAGFTITATFLYLYFLPDEPFHPGAWIVCLLALSLWVGGGFLQRERVAAAAVIAGVATALLFLLKINVGLFHLAGIGTWALLHATSDSIRRGARWLAGPLLVVFAAGLMHALVRESWVQIYLVVFGAGALAFVATLPGSATFTPRHAASYSAAFGATALLILGFVAARGTSIAGLIEGVLLGPLRHPASYSYPVDWRPGAVVVAALSLALAFALPSLRRRHGDARVDRLLIALRLLQTAALAIAIALLMHSRVLGAVFTYVAPSIWLWVVPLSGAKTSRAALLARSLLGSVLLLQYLHAYPVGGSQVSWATFLFIPLAALGFDEVRHWWSARAEAGTGPRWIWPSLAAALLVIATGKALSTAYAMCERYTHRSLLGLPGTANLHLPATQATAYRILRLNAAVHADMLFSLPGMFSLNLWTGLPTPTSRNTTLWFTLLNAQEQADIITALTKDDRPVVIVQESLVELMRAGKVPMGGPLWDFLAASFTPAFRVEGFAFHVRKGRVVAPVNVARIGPIRPAANDGDTEIEFSLLSDGTPIAAIDVRDVGEHPAPGFVLNAANASVRIAAIDRTGRSAGPLAPAGWPLAVRGLVHVSVRFRAPPAGLPPLTTVFTSKSASGDSLGEIRIAE
jgi:hypothetical protein